MSESRGKIVFSTIGDTISQVGSGTWQGVGAGIGGKPSGLGHTRWEGYTHAAMWDMLMRSRPDSMFEKARDWDELRTQIQGLNDSVQQKLATVLSSWRGSAAAGMANSGTTLLSWANEASHTTGSVATHLEGYTNSLVRARHAMPPPPETSVRKWYRGADAEDRSGPEGAFMLHRLSMDQAANAAKEREAKHEAMRVMRGFESESAEIHQTVGTFRKAPAITTTGGNVDNPPQLIQQHPPTTTPHPVPEPLPNPGPGPGTHPMPWPGDGGGGELTNPPIGTTSSSSFDPSAFGSGGYGSGGSSGYGSGGFGAGGFGPGSGGDATLSGGRLGGTMGGSVGAGSFGPTGAAAAGQAAAGARGGAGMGGMYPPMGGAQGQQEREHKRSRYLVGEDLFEDEVPLPPAVLDASQRDHQD